MQFAFPGKRRVTPNSIHGNTHEFGSKLLEFWQNFIIQSHLIATDRTPICREKRQDEWLTAKICEAHGLVRSAFEAEIRSPDASTQRLRGVTFRVQASIFLLIGLAFETHSFCDCSAHAPGPGVWWLRH